MFDMIKMMGKLKEAQAKMKETTERLALLRHTAESGGGLVVATVTGKRELLQLEIDPTLINPADKQMLQDLVVAAVNKALAEIDNTVREEMQQSTRGMLPDIPGLDLNNLV